MANKTGKLVKAACRIGMPRNTPPAAGLARAAGDAPMRAGCLTAEYLAARYLTGNCAVGNDFFGTRR